MAEIDSAGNLLISALAVQCPPVLPDVDQVLEQFLTKPEQLVLHCYEKSLRFLPRKLRCESCYAVDVTPVQTVLEVERNQATGKLLGFYENYSTDVGKSAKNSTSLCRLPGAAADGIFGSTTNYPFWPGGLDEPGFDVLNVAVTDEESNIDFVNDLLTCPPGFASGVQFEQRKFDGVLSHVVQPSTINISDILSASTDIDLEPVKDDVNQKNEGLSQPESVVTDVGIDQIIEQDSLLGQQQQKQQQQQQQQQPDVIDPAKPAKPVVEEFAVIVDVTKPVTNFDKLVPNMAHQYPFELDTFQKRAILHMEKNDNVFVAAHTSAGKTVVAEYAVALSLQHMAKAIYTSPIKALSNQKFREFKEKFKDQVGLVTGDVQIKPDADCLIMTTEILRSMLYRGSDVIRDLDWVIFDEVHYINDTERGVVWEEVLIMLPPHVKIVMLSATVPNTKEFAEWVGRTKRKTVYVVSTPRRPVPLEHYLYTGNSNKTINETFLLVDAQMNFQTTGYNNAVQAKKERASKSSQSFGAKGIRHNVSPQQDKNIWLSVVDMLKKKDKMPAVAFIFSKKRIEETADYLSTVSLVDSQNDRSRIYTFFENSISILKGPDRKLPQVLRMRELLHRGIGIHHSGVLPILKEVVEMLFQMGLVKILLATETFAMGVNMPARTVVFDSMRKHDGTGFRDLLPGEYIQMAGRAGRRGLDATGTVILLCKGDVPEMADLHRMMLGKPTRLESQFRLTYSMILSLLRVEQLRMEDMIKRSFGEFHSQKDTAVNMERLKEIESKRQNFPEVIDYSGDLAQYYRSCDEYFQLRQSVQAAIFGQHVGSKTLCPGRVVVLDTRLHRNALAVILQGPVKDKSTKALVLCNANPTEITSSGDDDWSILPRPVREQYLFIPDGQPSHAVIDITVDDIATVTSRVLKISADKILEDSRKRELPRFRNDPPGPSSQVATQELMRLAERNANGLPSIDPINDLQIKDFDLVQDIKRLTYLADTLPSFKCIHDINFEENFRQMRSNMKLEEEFKSLKILLSDQSLALLPEYQQRVQVLTRLEYINNERVVTLKGRVACELTSCGGHELLVTELIFANVFAELSPPEVAAMLSSVVCQERRCVEPNLTPTLEKSRDQFLVIATQVANLQKECGVPICVEEYCDSLLFGLTEVVFEWARGMQFAKITELTDIQEGIIVRCIQRLDETLRDLRSAARVVGDPVLQRKAEEASSAIKRDIVFAASLYTQ